MLPAAARLEGMTEDFGFAIKFCSARTDRTLITLEATGGNRTPPVRSWRLSDDLKHVTLGESLRGDQLKARLSPVSRTGDSARGPFRLSRRPRRDNRRRSHSTMAVSLESGDIELYRTESGYCCAVCRIVGPEVVFVPRADLDVRHTPAEVENIGRVACASRPANTRDRSVRVPRSSGHVFRPMGALLPSSRGTEMIRLAALSA